MNKHSVKGASPATLAELQHTVDQWITNTGVRYFDPMTNMAILTEELGEVARLMARIHGEQSFRPDDPDRQNPHALADEMADVLWVLLALANQTGVDLTTAFERTLQKKTARDSGRHKINDKLSATDL